MSSIAVIGDRDTVTGFRLAGVVDIYETKHQEVEDILDRISQKDYKLLIITENLAAYASKQLKGFEERRTPVIVSIPDKTGSTGYTKNELKELVRRAVGVDITKGKEGGT